MQTGISVHREHRQQGIGRELFRLVVEAAEEEGRRRIIGSTSERIPAGAAFAKGVGAEAGIEERISRLVLDEVDRELVDRWLAEGPGRAQGYSLVAIDGPYPENMLEDIAAVHMIMNTAPRDDLDIEDWEVKPEHLREENKQLEATGSQRWTLLARHDATGKLVGFTEVGWNPKIPPHVWQYGTGVDPAHRGHALGKWLKAAMMRRILDERTEAVEIRTGNAFSNDAMLGINTQLGFELYYATTGWQITLDQARAYLGSST
jgi:GNAT superfamily N-acetyltransferase